MLLLTGVTAKPAAPALLLPVSAASAGRVLRADAFCMGQLRVKRPGARMRLDICALREFPLPHPDSHPLREVAPTDHRARPGLLVVMATAARQPSTNSPSGGPRAGPCSPAPPANAKDAVDERRVTYGWR
jgi:hypothetical protein